AVAHQERMDVAPAPPHIALQRKECALALGLAQRIDERPGRVGDLSRRHAGLLDREESRSRGAAGRDALEGLGEESLAGFDVLLELWRKLGLTGSRGDRRARAHAVTGRRTSHRREPRARMAAPRLRPEP